MRDIVARTKKPKIYNIIFINIPSVIKIKRTYIHVSRTLTIQCCRTKHISNFDFYFIDKVSLRAIPGGPTGRMSCGDLPAFCWGMDSFDSLE